MSNNFLNFLSRKIEVMRPDENSSRLENFTVEVENLFNNDNGINSQQLTKEIDYDKLAEHLATSEDSYVASELSIDVGNIFEEFISLVGKDQIDGVLDDGYKDGIITSDEIEKYMEQLMGEDKLLTLSDFDNAIALAGINIDEKIEELTSSSSTKKKAKTSKSSGSSQSTSNYNSTQSSSSTNSSKTEDNTSKKAVDDMSLRELKKEQPVEVQNLSAYRSAVSNAINQRSENQTKQQAYIDQLNATKDETAMELATTIQNISEFEDSILETQESINISEENVISLKSEVVNLNSSVADYNARISALENQYTVDKDGNQIKVDNSTLISELNSAIQQAQSQIAADEQKIQDEETNIETNQEILETDQKLCEEEKDKKADLEKQLNVELKNQLSQAKADYETEYQQNSEAISYAQNLFQTSQQRIEDINDAIVQKDVPKDYSNQPAGEVGPLYIAGLKYQQVVGEKGSDDGIYEYAIIAPENVDADANLPVLFYMTGRGTNEAGMDVAQYNVFGKVFQQGGFNGFNGIVVIPLSKGDATEITDSHINDVMDICDEIKEQYPNADTRNMGLVGFSDGATRAYQVANADELNSGTYHFDSVVMIDRAEGYTSADDEAFRQNNINLGVYYSGVYAKECTQIQAAEFSQYTSGDHSHAQDVACSKETLEWLFQNRPKA